MTTFSLRASKAIHSIIGEYETELRHFPEDGWREGLSYPRPSFSEALRAMPAIAERAWGSSAEASEHIDGMVRAYLWAKTEEEGTREAESYLIRAIYG